MPLCRPSTAPQRHAHALPLPAAMRTIPLTSHVMCLVAKSLPNTQLLRPAVRLWRHTPRVRPLHTSAAQGTRAAPAGDSFLDTSTDHEQLGISPAVANALRAAGFAHPSKVQALAWPALLHMQDVVLAAETGSGKTMAYLAPLFVHLLAQQPGGQDDMPPPAALVLCPNAALCQQVQHVAQTLLHALNQESPLRAAWVGSSSPPSPSQRVDLAIATPAALLNILYETGTGLG